MTYVETLDIKKGIDNQYQTNTTNNHIDQKYTVDVMEYSIPYQTWERTTIPEKDKYLW